MSDTDIRLYVEAPLAAGAALTLGAGQAHYLAAVMRRRAGDTLLLFNGRDGEWRAEIDALSKRAGRLVCAGPTRPQSAGPDLWLLFAPVKRALLDRIARMATELGVSALWPVITRNTVAWRVNLDRLAANAVEAAEQCGRLDVPACREPASLAAVLADWPAGRRLVFCDESGAGTPIAEALAGAPGGPWAIVIGPEGGFTATEASLLAAVGGVVRVSLGPRTLRSETAAAAALACLQALAGDWRG